MTWFLYRLSPPRADFATTMSEEEQQVMAEHAAYWTGHLDGACVLFSPVGDPAGVWGVALLRGGSAEEVEALAAGDPAVTSGTCTGDVLPLLAPVTHL
jgi:uncharacterized protein